MAEQLWAPWRIQYIEMEKPQGCVLCQKLDSTDDAESLILYRGTQNIVMLNKYPYNPGHIMVTPMRHIGRLDDFTADEIAEHYDLVRKSVKALQKTMSPQGFNIGMNLGRVAGAGIEDHLHTHIVPRWNGDTNFMPVVGQTRVISEALTDTYKKLLGKIA
ncbi:MAG: HIT domain-containing protein [Dehalococcoidia bacterium]|nr:HIT domain-containing protein [Dehalococcoidia bacterium]